MMRQDDSGIKVDGGMSENDLLCQILSDISGWVVIRPKMVEATALGAAMMAGNALGLWDLKPEEDPFDETIIHEEPNHVNADGNAISGVNANSHHRELARQSSVIDNIKNFYNEASRRFSTASITSITSHHRHRNLHSIERDISNFDVFKPRISETKRFGMVKTWKSAVQRSMKWIKVGKKEQKIADYKRLASIPFTLFTLLSWTTLILSERLPALYQH
jgi:glycerol kinase